MSYETIECEFKSEKEEFIVINDGDNNYIIPKSVIEETDFDEFKKGEIITINVEEWFIIEAELDASVI